jgi:hypothetical protein
MRGSWRKTNGLNKNKKLNSVLDEPKCKNNNIESQI